MQAGHDYIGVGVGALVLNDKGEAFLAQRGPQAKNERGSWEFPGGSLDWGERLEDAIVREFAEEYGMIIVVERLLHVVDHLLPDEGQHWVSPTYLARHVGGEPRIVEPEKCSAIGWFALDALPSPLSKATEEDVRVYQTQSINKGILSLDHVQLAMPRGAEEQARAFYSGILGMHEIAKPAPLAARGGCWFQGHNAQLHLGVEEPFSPALKAHPALIVGDLHEFSAMLSAAGISVTPDTAVSGTRRAYVADPFGNRIELIQNGDGFNQRGAR